VQDRAVAVQVSFVAADERGGALAECARASDSEPNVELSERERERMMGLEPTTFCMASGS
jgi:hypothetical protein